MNVDFLMEYLIIRWTNSGKLFSWVDFYIYKNILSALAVKSETSLQT